MRKLIRIFFFLASLSLEATSFLLSEVFNDPGEKRGWIELVNTSKNPIDIYALDLTIKNKDAVIFQKAASFLKPMVFTDYLLLAQERNLGLDHCLRDDISVLVLPGLSIEPEQEICITLNGETECTKFDVKFLKKTSLFRELNDQSSKPLWRHEPCHLIDGFFATPAKPARSCAMDVFKRCNNMVELCLDSPKIEANFAEINVIRENEQIVEVGISQGADSLVLTSLCAAPKGSKKICHLLDEGIVVPSATTMFKIASWQKNMGHRIFLMTNEFNKLAQFNLKEKVSAPLVLPHVQRVDQRIVLNLKEDLFPLNIKILAKNDIISTKAFVTPGEKIIDISKGYDEIVLLLISSDDEIIGEMRLP